MKQHCYTNGRMKRRKNNIVTPMVEWREEKITLLHQWSNEEKKK
jgi:hypothetical protein